MSDVKQDQTVPVSGLGKNFEKPVLPLMAMATKARVWGDATPNAIEPNPAQLTTEMRATITFVGFTALSVDTITTTTTIRIYGRKISGL